MTESTVRIPCLLPISMATANRKSSRPNTIPSSLTRGCRLFVYKLADPKGTAWYRYVLDDHFEQHDGAKVIELAPGKFGILGHGWAESKFVHLWRPD